MDIRPPMVILLFLVLFAPGAEACLKEYVVSPAPEQPFSQPSCQVIGDRFFIDGPIDYSVLGQFLELQKTIKKVYLNSQGGIVGPAKQIARVIRDREIETVLREGTQCLSSCTLLFQAGVRRTAHSYSALLYHGVGLGGYLRTQWLLSCSGQPDSQRCQDLLQEYTDITVASTERYFDLLESYGLSPDLYEELLAQPIDPEWFSKSNFFRRENLIFWSTTSRQYGAAQHIDDSEK